MLTFVLKLVLANPVGDVAEKLNRSELWDLFKSECMYMSVDDAVIAISSRFKSQV